MTNSPDQNTDGRATMLSQDTDSSASMSENTSFVQMFLDASSRRGPEA